MIENVKLTINEKEVSVPARTLLVDAARMAGVEIPVFCSHPKLDPVGCCRMCLVEVDGPRGTAMMASCTMPVGDGMVVRTNTEAGANCTGSQSRLHPAQSSTGLPHM